MKKNVNQMIQWVLNTSNNKKNEIVYKTKRKKFEFNAYCHNIKFEIAKTEITRLDLNNCDCRAL